MSPAPALIWFRRDLRLNDHPALARASEGGRELIAVFIREAVEDHRPPGAASAWWLDKSLQALGRDIAARGGRLVLRTGDPADCLTALCGETGADRVVWSRRYGGAERRTDERVKSALKGAGIEAVSVNGSLLSEPWSLTTGSGGHFRVFTPYWKALRASYAPHPPLPAPQRFGGSQLASERLEDWDLHPTSPDWSTGFAAVWRPGEAGARERLGDFVSGGLKRYGEDRNRPDLAGGTSGLSPHLAFGEISPVTIWRAAQLAMAGMDDPAGEASAWTFLSEIAWREFSYVLLYHHPDLARQNYNRNFDAMEWRHAADELRLWQRGQTGYPMVDAGMRQLWQTGWMHNRVRMVVASFLTKHLLIDWRAGEDWFWDTLVDADPASNAASWQWTAGSGADAAPYFRVFNPISQGTKFDPDGAYVRRYVPELARLPDTWIHAPWEAPAHVLASAGVRLGGNYPARMVEHALGRERALRAYEGLKKAGETV